MKNKILFILINISQLAFSQIDSISYYYNKGEYKKSIKYGELLLSYYDKKILKKDEGFVNTLSWLSILTEKENDTIKREKYIKLLEQNLSYCEENYKSVIQNYYLIAKNYKTQKKYDLAEDFFLKTINLSELKNFEEEVYFYSLQLLGQIYFDQDRIILHDEEIKKNFDKQLLISEKLYTKNSYDYAFALNNLGLYFNQKEDYERAEKYFVESMSILESIYGREDERYIVSIDNLTKQYLLRNNLPKADLWNQKGLDIIEEKYGKENKDYLSFLVNKATIKSELGEYDIAFWLLDECFYLSKKLYGENSSYFSSVVSNIGTFLYNKNEFKLAESYYLKDYEITKSRFGENHFKTAMCLNRLSAVYYFLKEDLKAIEYNLKALKIVENSIGQESSFYLKICSDLGTLYSSINEFTKAELYYNKSFIVEQKLLGENSTSRITNLSNLITFYRKYAKNENHNKYLLEYLKLLKIDILNMNSSFTQSELSSYFKKILQHNTYFSILNLFPNQYPEINIGCYENELLVKNLSLRNQQRIKVGIQKSGDTKLISNYQQFIANKRQLNKLQELPTDKRPASFEQLTVETEQLEKDLTRQSSAFADAKRALSITWKQVQEKLQPNEIAIDLVAYNYYNKKWTDSIVYAAFVVKKQYKAPKYIPLFEQKQLEFLLHKNKTENDSASSNKQYTNKAISNLFLKPLEQELKGCTIVYLSPAGLGHQINFKALPISEIQTFGEKYQIHQLGSTSELVTYKMSQLDKNTNLQLYLYGGINYDKKENTTKEIENNDALITFGFNEMSTRSGITNFSYLPGTKIEVNQIATASAQNGFVTTEFMESNATEESIKQLDGKTTPYVLHLATHGFFFPDPKQQKPETLQVITNESGKSKIYKTSDDPMMRSGLLFAGANKYWGKTSENESADDGILTASEISNLDLSSCQLVVMSACETGLGEINGSEGVFGLQRAFKMAGVKNIIMSLWKVPDAQTAELFTVFYSECLGGKSIHEAFQIAQAKMRVKYSPYYWAGFVLLE